MRKIYHLSTCDTSKKILKELDIPFSFILQDIKKEPITKAQLEEMKKLSGSYEALFSKRARLYKERELKDEALTEDRYKNLILEHYTFLKRPVLMVDGRIFAGNAKKNLTEAKTAIHG